MKKMLTNQAPDPVVTIVFFVIVILVALAIVFKAQVLAGARAAGGLTGGNFGTAVKNNWGYITSGGIVIVSAVMIYLGFLQLWFICVAVLTFVVAVHKHSWFIGSIAILLLFLSLTTSIHFMRGSLNWYNSFAPEPPAETVQELEGRTMHIEGNRMDIAIGERPTRMIAHPVNAYGPGGYNLCVMPEKTFTYNTDHIRSGYITILPPQNGVWTEITVWWQRSPDC